MPAGKLRDRCIIEARTDVAEDPGSLHPVWTPITSFSLPCDAKPIVGRRNQEITLAAVVHAVTVYLIRLHFRTDVTAKHRITLIGPPNIVMNISNVVDPDGRRHWLDLLCETGLKNG